MDRIDAGTVAVAFLGQDIESPQIIPSDGEGGGPVADDGGSAGIFQHRLGAGDIGAEVLRALLIGTEMGVAVTGELMAFLDDSPDQGRIAFRHPAKGEKGRLDTGAGEYFQHLLRVTLHPAGLTVPDIAPETVGEGLHLEVILDIDAHGVLCGRGRRGFGAKAGDIGPGRR